MDLFLGGMEAVMDYQIGSILSYYSSVYNYLHSDRAVDRQEESQEAVLGDVPTIANVDIGSVIDILA